MVRLARGIQRLNLRARGRRVRRSQADDRPHQMAVFIEQLIQDREMICRRDRYQIARAMGCGAMGVERAAGTDHGGQFARTVSD